MTGLGSARARLLVLVCCLAVLMVGLDSTALNVALPAMQRQLHTSVSGMQWVVDAYNLVVAALILLTGSTGDRVGRRRVFMAGAALFAVGSTLCALASSLECLVGFRVIQALGGVMIAPASLSLITHAFPDQAVRSRAIGIWSAAFGTGLALGPIIGGALVASAGWRSIFWINVPVAALAVVLSHRFVAESRAARARRADPVAQLLVIVLLGSVSYGVIEAPRNGWTSGLIVGCLAVAVAALAALVVWERRRDEPLVETRFFRSVPFSGSVVVSLASFAALGGFLFVNTLYLQDVRGMSALAAGLWMLPMAAMTVVCAPLAGRLAGRSGPRVPVVLSGAAMALSGLLLAVCHAESSGVALCVAYALFGASIGLVDVPATALAVAGMPREQAGTASAITMSSCRIGVALGVAVFGSVLAEGLHRTTGHAARPMAGFLAAAQPIWWLVVGCGLVVGLLGVLVSGAWATSTAREAVTGLSRTPALENAES
ncbi:MFS transporter [Streptomyces sp. cg36]|uniref:MFS transporter n=1 Tax=Streptomyces sp. cg36 TaxID=3238798 RepID=UPI0034E29F7E